MRKDILRVDVNILCSVDCEFALELKLQTERIWEEKGKLEVWPVKVS